ncbi:MAG: hypothetical protein PUC67_03920 [Coriobacteriaceae bacterium]|nr:hypothetical protein [Coriobacteriaceae bacterium]
MQSLRYTSRGLRRRNNTDKREVTLPHVDPVTGETARTSRTVGAKTKKGAEKAGARAARSVVEVPARAAHVAV